MNAKTLFPCAILVAAGLALTAPFSVATLTYNDGDILLGFYATSGTGSSTDYLLDLGSAANFVAGGSFATGQPVKLNLGNIGADLVATYGATWATNANLNWSIDGTQNVAGNGFAKSTIFATEPENSVGIQSSAPPKPSLILGNTVSGLLNSQGNTYIQGTTNDFGGGLANGDQVQSTNAAGGLLQPTSFPNSFASFQPGGNNTTGAESYKFFNPANLNNFADGTAGSVNDLYSLSSTAAGVQYQGVFQLDNSGNLYFDSAAPNAVTFPLVPEPTSLAMLTLGAGFFGFARRRAVKI